MTASKSSTTQKCLIGILVLWSLASLILIVVWATSPEMKGVTQCNADRKALEQKYSEEKSVWGKDRHAMEEMVREGQRNQSKLQTHIDQFKAQLQILNQSLDSCRQQNDLLRVNITLLEGEIEKHDAIEVNLTAEIKQQQEVIDHLNLNLTQIINDNQACMNLKEASVKLEQAAINQRDSCQANTKILQKKIDKCQIQTISTQQESMTSPNNDGPPASRGSLFLLMLLLISMLLFS